MKRTLLFLFLILSVEFVIAQNNSLSNQAEISVLTVGPGESLNDAFGHSAFRIKDEMLGIDVTYGYGEYDFETPNFYIKFAQGKLNYLMSETHFNRFFQIYKYYNRTIKEQVLNLTQAEKQKLFDYLVNNYKPENRAYLYDFFYDNCATKIKDVTNITVNNSIKFNTPEHYKEATFRTLIQENLNRNSWGSLGIDVALGSVIDRNATPEDHMFLPKNIYAFFEVATIGDSNKPLVSSNKVIYTKKNVPESSSFLLSPLVVFGLIGALILFVTYKDYKNNTQSKWLDIVLFSTTGVVGIFILLLWFATDHKGTHNNYNLLWAFALNIFVIGQFFKEKISTWFLRYVKLLIIFLCLLTLHWFMGVQIFAASLIPFLIALGIRYLFLAKYYSKNQN